MKPEMYNVLASLFVGAAVAAASFFGREFFALAFGAIERDIGDKLRRMRASPKRLRAWLVAWLSAVAVAFFGFSIFLNNVVFGVLISGLMLALPWFIVRRLAEQRRLKIEDQLADSMVTLSNAVKAGLSLAQSLELLAAELPKPINAEFHQIVAEYKLGKPLERTLTEAKERLGSENFALFAAAIMASHDSGGRLNETVERIAQSVLEMQRLDRKIRSETAQARKSAVYMALAPALILVVYYFVDPDNTTRLFTTVVGQVLLAIAVTLNLIAYFWARVILNPDI